MNQTDEERLRVYGMVGMFLKAFILASLLCASSLLLHCQTLPPQASTGDFFGAGVSYGPNLSPKFQAQLFGAIPFNKQGTMSWTGVDILLLNRKLTTAIESGIAQPCGTAGSLHFYCLAAAGAGMTAGTPSGTSLGGAFSGGVLPLYRPWANRSFWIGVPLRIISVSGTGRAASMGLLVVWGTQ